MNINALHFSLKQNKMVCGCCETEFKTIETCGKVEENHPCLIRGEHYTIAMKFRAICKDNVCSRTRSIYEEDIKNFIRDNEQALQVVEMMKKMFK